MGSWRCCAVDPAPGLVGRVRELEVTLNGEGDAQVPTTGGVKARITAIEKELYEED